MLTWEGNRYPEPDRNRSGPLSRPKSAVGWAMSSELDEGLGAGLPNRDQVSVGDG